MKCILSGEGEGEDQYEGEGASAGAGEVESEGEGYLSAVVECTVNCREDSVNLVQ